MEGAPMASKAKRKPFSYRDQRSATKDDINIGLRTRMKRVELDMSQQELGKTLGVSFQQVQKYEKGTNRISGNRLREVCIALQVDPNYLLGWEGKSLKLEDAQVKDSMLFAWRRRSTCCLSKFAHRCIR
jgi:DNA-binding XRE family transcriptional regulator